jgi:DNA repair exonuclease SbcCD ATPase subunit
MKVQVENFKCWENNEFTFPDNIMLLNGQSGCGKSSILDAIYFALTGEGKNIVTFGKTSCKVTLELSGYKIIRSKRPNRLIFEKNGIAYEDDIAQSFIDDLFSNNFNTIGYISQKDTSSFLRLSPLAKLEFLESLSLESFKLNDKKQRLKGEIANRRKAIDEMCGKLKIAKDLFTNTEPIKKLSKFPINSDLSNEEVIQKYTTLLHESKNGYETILTKYTKATNQMLKNKELDVHKKFLTVKKEDLHVKQHVLENTIEKIDDTYLQTLLGWRSEIDTLETIQKVNEDLTSRKKMLEKERNAFEIEKQEKLNSLSIWPNETEQEANDMIQSLKDILPDMQQIEYLENSVKLLKEKQSSISFDPALLNTYITQKQTLETKLQNCKLSKNVYVCPCCTKPLKFDGNTLKEFQGILEKDNEQELSQMISSLSQKIDKLNKQKSMLENIVSDINSHTSSLNTLKESYEEIISSNDIMSMINDTKQYIQENKGYEKEFTQLKNTTTNNTIIFIEKEISAFEQKLSQLSKLTITVRMSRPELEECISKEKEKMHRYTSNMKELDRIKNEYTSILKELEKITIEDIDLVSIEKEMEEVKEKMKKYEKYTEKLNAWKLEKEKYDLYMHNKQMYETLLKEEDELKLKYESVLILKEKIQYAESVYIENYIQKINENIQKYLDTFFVDNPMEFSIKTQKTTQKSEIRNQINVEIIYKANEVDITTLSGGEYDRVNLAITLALAEVYNLPFLILDECLSSLDYENFDNVISSIKEMYNGRKVIIVSHQANEGLFDKIIHLE